MRRKLKKFKIIWLNDATSFAIAYKTAVNQAEMNMSYLMLCYYNAES